MKWKSFLWLIFLASLWGPSFVFIKIAVGEIPPLTLVATRVGIAAILLFVILRMQGGAIPPLGKIWWHFAVMGLVGNAMPFVLFSWAELHIDSALAAILNGTTPIFTILLAHFYVADDRMTPTKFVGVLIGFAGMLVLIGPSLMEGFQLSTWGLIAMTVAAGCYAIAIVYSRKYLRGLPRLVAPTAQLTMATVYLLPLSLLIDQPFSLPMPSMAALGSLLTLTIFGTAIAFVVYYHIMETTSATYLSMVTYVIPVFGVITSVIVLNEVLQWNTYLGFGLILLGVMVVNGLFRQLNLWRRLSADAVAQSR